MGEKGSKIPKMINMASTGLRISTRLANKPKQNMVYFLNHHEQWLDNISAKNPIYF